MEGEENFIRMNWVEVRVTSKCLGTGAYGSVVKVSPDQCRDFENYNNIIRRARSSMIDNYFNDEIIAVHLAFNFFFFAKIIRLSWQGNGTGF